MPGCTIGIAKLKEQQKVAVGSFLRGNDVFVSLPTGYGKSICFALLPLVFDRELCEVDLEA